MPSKPSVKAYRGDAKTLLAFDLPKASTKNLAGFTIACQPGDQPPYYLHNTLQFQTPADHAQDPKEPPISSINAPFHKFRWLHIPGVVHQGTQPFLGAYKYTVTPRYFDDRGSLQPLDPALSASIKVQVVPFEKKAVKLGFTRGFTQSQAFVHHFGLKAAIRPKGNDLLFDTQQVSGKNAAGETYTYADQYEWLGFTARQRIFDVLEEVLNDSALRADVFAYDLNEPDVVTMLLKLARQGRVRIILDNASLHKSTAKKPAFEDEFEQQFRKVAKKDGDGEVPILRGKFGRYAHDKVVIVSNGSGARKVLTGSTNFSVTGLYVNSNHVVVFDDPTVAAKYADVFEAAWQSGVKLKGFLQSPLSSETASFSSRATPQTEVTFSPHQASVAESVLDGLVARVAKEGKKKRGGSVLFAVMQLDSGTGPVYAALQKLHAQQNIFSYGISDTPGGIALYTPRKKTGVLVTGKPVGTKLPPPFDQVPGIGGVGHQIHHKFVICGFNGDDPVVYCGSSNLALGGEENNGDNLLAIHDADVAVAFAIEALALVDHFDFLDRYATAAKGKAGGNAKKGGRTTRPKVAPAAANRAPSSDGWFLGTNDAWAAPYYDANDLHCVDRELFAGD